MIEIKEVRDLNVETDFDKYKKMIESSEIGNTAKIREGYIIYDGEEIVTKEIVFDSEFEYNSVVIFCASDESYVTTEVQRK